MLSTFRAVCPEGNNRVNTTGSRARAGNDRTVPGKKRLDLPINRATSQVVSSLLKAPEGKMKEVKKHEQ
jgi:hypothetical protein